MFVLFGNFSVSAFFNLFIMFWPFFKKNDADIGLRRQKSMVWAQTICDQELGSRGIFRFSAFKTKIDKNFPLSIFAKIQFSTIIFLDIQLQRILTALFFMFFLVLVVVNYCLYKLKLLIFEKKFFITITLLSKSL